MPIACNRAASAHVCIFSAPFCILYRIASQTVCRRWRCWFWGWNLVRNGDRAGAVNAFVKVVICDYALANNWPPRERQTYVQFANAIWLMDDTFG